MLCRNDGESVVFVQISAIAQRCSTEDSVNSQRHIPKLFINKATHWGFFDRVYQRDRDYSGAGRILYFSDTRYIKFKAGLDVGTNNLTELMAIKPLLRCAFDRNITRLQIFGNSTLAINCMNRTS